MAAEDDFDTALSAVATALGSGNYQVAWDQTLVASAHNLRIPDEVHKDGVSIKYRNLEQLKKLQELILERKAQTDKFEVHSRWVL